VCNGRDDHAERFLDYLAALVQRPWRRTGVAVVLTGLQGTGKNTVVDFFRTRILGDRITSHLQNARHALFSRFAEAQDETVFIQIDEFAVHGAQQIEALKHLITGDSIRVERKYW
jgi:phage/plasmid-associated DNA primase